MKVFYILLLVIIGFSSCNSQKILYFSNLPDTTLIESKVNNYSHPTIQEGDVLSIQVSSLNPESNVLFNSGALQQFDSRVVLGSNISNSSLNASNRLASEGYEVDANGNISFPVIGKMKLAGLTKEQAQTYLVDQISEYVKNPIVNVRFLNFRITVIGEVQRPATFNVASDKINVLEALGLAGDMTLFGMRDRVLLIREVGDKRSMIRINLQDVKIFDSPYFYLKQNDVLYVEPNKIRDPNGERTIRLVTAVATVVTAVSLFVMRVF